MREWLERSETLNNFHWQGGALQWLFYAGIIIILLFERNRSKRIVFAWVPICYLICIFNPLFTAIQSWTDIGDRQYFVRLFSFMPIMYSIAYGCVILLKKAHKWFKPVLLIGLCIAFFLTGRNIYDQSWYVVASNHAKVDQETYEILAALKNEEEPIKIATINPVANYIRQVADVITPYARDMGELGIILSQEIPDVDSAMRLAGNLDIDYIVPRKTEEVENAFKERGYTPYKETNEYVIYKVTGVSRVKRSFNEKRQIVLETNYGCDDSPEQTVWGYTSIAYEYDRYGNPIRKSFLDEDGNLFMLDGIYSTIVREYSNRGKELSISFLDQNNESVFLSGRYLTRYEYDSKGRCIKETYHDINGELMNRTDVRYAYKTFEYGDNNHVRSVRYYNDKNALTLDSLGYAGYNDEYFEQEGQRIKRTYVDLNENEICSEIVEVI